MQKNSCIKYKRQSNNSRLCFSPQSVPPPWAAGALAQRLQPSSEVSCDHHPGFPDAVLPADHHEGAAWNGWCDPSLCPRPPSLGGGEPASHWWGWVGRWSSLCGVPAGQPQRPAPDCRGLQIQDRKGQSWRGSTLIRTVRKDFMLSDIVVLILKVTSFFVFFRLSCLLPARVHTENTWVNWTCSMANYW